jgi:hypothetical protein
MQKSNPFPAAACAAALLALPALAGGFYLTLGNPEASPEAQAMKAVVTVLPTGCHNPEKAKISATAIGMVDGQRRSMAVELKPLPRPGFYAITRQWPSDGKWLLQVVAVDEDRVTSVLIPVSAAGADRRNARYIPRAPQEGELSAALAAN